MAPFPQFVVITDYSKCEHKISLHVDQVLHTLCKVAYVYVNRKGLV